MSTISVVGFVLTGVALVVFMVVSWRQLVRIRRIGGDEDATAGTDG